MTIKTYTPKSTVQGIKRLSSKDEIWILTDIHSYAMSYHSWSPQQEWFDVGAFDLCTERLGVFSFTIDDARAMLRVHLPEPPWHGPLPFAIEVFREGHVGTELGRFRVKMEPISLPPDLLAQGPELRAQFASHARKVNSGPGMWKRIAEPIALEKKIEAAALAMTGTFSASQLRSALGGDVNVSPVLTDLVDRDLLVRTGKKKGTRYEVAS